MQSLGRPSTFSDELADAICDRIARGESVVQIGSDENMPSETTIYRWLGEREGFRERYAHAREHQADGKFDEAWSIAKAATAENVQVARLQVDTIKWQAAKLAPKKYGDKVNHEHTGEGGGAIAVAVKFV